jgi:hypothetical protein
MFTTLNAKCQGSSENPSYDISGSGKFNPQPYLFLLFSPTLLTVIQTKSTNQMPQSLRFIACHLNTAQHISGILLPTIDHDQ